MVVILFLLLFVLLILWCFVENNYFNKINESNFLSKESTGALRGVAIIAIVFSHIFQNAPEIKELLWGGKYLYTLVFMWGGDRSCHFFHIVRIWVLYFVKKSKKQVDMAC